MKKILIILVILLFITSCYFAEPPPLVGSLKLDNPIFEGGKYNRDSAYDYINNLIYITTNFYQNKTRRMRLFKYDVIHGNLNELYCNFDDTKDSYGNYTVLDYSGNVWIGRNSTWSIYRFIWKVNSLFDTDISFGENGIYL